MITKSTFLSSILVLVFPILLSSQPGINAPGLNISVPAQIYANQSFTVTYSVYHTFSIPVEFIVTGNCNHCSPMAGACLPFTAAPFMPTTCSVVYNLNDIPAGTNVNFTAGATFINPDALPFPLPGSFSAMAISVMALPVDFIFFNALENNGQVILNWATGSETNNEAFYIEHSLDGQKFNTIGKIEGAGNSQIIKEYQYKDDNPHNGINYYRLRQQDFDGSIEYSAVVSTFIGKKDEAIVIYPNPTSESAFVYFQNELSTSPDEVVLYNALGTIVKVYKGQDLNTDGNLNIDMSDLNSGTYFLNIKAGRKSYFSRVQKN
jgi:hypothetical protein